MNIDSLTSIEKKALQLLLAGDDSVLAKLRTQLAVARIKSREYTGVGYVTYFWFDSPLEPLLEETDSVDISDVVARLPSEMDTLMFHLSVRKGHLDYFEVSTVGDEWPAEQIDNAELMYFDRVHAKGRPDRDLVLAREQWMGTGH